MTPTLMYACPECRRRGRLRGQCLGCGFEGPLPLAAREEGARVVSLADAEDRELLKLPGVVAQACGGAVWRTGTIVLTGPAGHGKSTEAARLVLATMREGLTHLILDREMAADVARATFLRAGATAAEIARVRRADGAVEWADARELVEAEAPDVVVVDSLDAWAGEHERTRRSILRDVADPETGMAKTALVIVIAQWSRSGHLRGTTAADHAADALVCITKRRVWQTKCRWCVPRSIRRKKRAPAGRAAPLPPRRRAARRAR